MIPLYRAKLITKQSLFIWMAACFIFCFSGLNAHNYGGNDTLASSAKSEISINKQKLLIRNMTAEQLSAFIDETFDLDTIPVDIINEINWAAARLEKKEGVFESVVSATPSPAVTPSKIEEIPKTEPTRELAKVKESAPVKTLKTKTFVLSENRYHSIPLARLKAPEVIVPIIKKVAMQLLPVAKLTATEKAVEAPVSKELVKNIPITIKEPVQLLPVAKLTATEKAVEAPVSKELVKTIPISEKKSMQSLPVAKLTATEKAVEAPVSKELVKKIEFNQMNTLKTNPVFLATDNSKGSVTALSLKAIEIITPAPYVVSSLPVAQLKVNELKNEISPIHNLVKNKEATNLKTFNANNIVLHMDTKMDPITITELKAIEILPVVKREIVSNSLPEDELFVPIDTIASDSEQSANKKPTPLTLLKMNLANNACIDNSTVASMTVPVNDLNIPIPSPDYYVSWEINKLFPEKDMLKMKSDTSITLVLLSKEHKHYFHPFNGPITSNFGWRDSAQHNGIDIDLNKGDKVSAAFDGMVRLARRYGGFGNVVIIRHYNGLETVYAHLSKIKVKPGQLISSGDLVGLGGSTGHSTGSHLHFEIRFKGVPMNPKYLISLSEQKLMCDEFTLKKTKWGLAVYPKNTKMYTVEKGDTVFEIAKRFGTTTASIKELNHLGGGRVRLKAGQQLNVAH